MQSNLPEAHTASDKARLKSISMRPSLLLDPCLQSFPSWFTFPLCCCWSVLSNIQADLPLLLSVSRWLLTISRSRSKSYRPLLCHLSAVLPHSQVPKLLADPPHISLLCDASFALSPPNRNLLFSLGPKYTLKFQH